MDNTVQTVEEFGSEEFASIIDPESTEISASAFQRYAVPPQFDGNSSEEDNEPQVEEKQVENVDDIGDKDQADAGYAPLVADEFGEFVSSEDFGDFYTPDRVGYLTEGLPAATILSDNTVEPVHSTSDEAATSSVRISIAPLDANKIQAIKAAMSKITIKNPNAGAVLLADALELKHIRLGDEITDN